MRYIYSSVLILILNQSLYAQEATLIDQCLAPDTPAQEKVQLCETAIEYLNDNTSEKQTHTQTSRIDLYLELTEVLTHKGEFIAAHRWLEKLQLLPEYLFSAEQRFNYFRRRGILNYRQNQLTDALSQFQSALSVAEKNKLIDNTAVALSDLGTTHSAMMNYESSLELFQKSLALKRDLDNSISTAITLNNIGNVYRNLDEWQQARVFYEEAINLYKSANQPIRVAHTQENLALIFVHEKRLSDAYSLLQKSYHAFNSANNQHAQLRLLILLAKLNIDTQKLEKAQQQLNAAQQLELKVGKNDQSNRLKLQLGRLTSLQGQYLAAESLLMTGFQDAKQAEQQELVIEFLYALTQNAINQKQWQNAYEYQKRYGEAQQQWRNSRFDQSLAFHRATLEFDQQNHQIELLNKEKTIQSLALKQQRSQNIILFLAIVLTILISCLIIFWLWKKRKIETQQLQEEINYHRSQVAALGASYESLQQAFGQIKQPIIIINNRKEIMFVNHAMNQQYQIDSSIMDASLEQLIPLSNQVFWQLWNNNETIDSQYLTDINLHAGNENYSVNLTVSTEHREEAITVIIISPAKAQEQQVPLDALLPKASFHQLLVDLMNMSIQAWENATQSTRIELAEKSGIWRVSIDDGRLRTRSLDRYLTLKSLPKRPRWREVIRTVHFVLAECTLDSDTKQAVKQLLESVQQHIRAESLI
ncbi:MAG: tetratricopeptide repeat protein [Gammaproteobacteria bacterium]|nr:tetratricopeptide repeat protein [Gammaproteobacteria bacterium]